MKATILRPAAATLLALAAIPAAAVPFDNTSSASPATAGVGLSGDYLTLSSAAAAFSAVAGGINRPWTLEIQNDLTESTNCYFGNSFGANGSLTIRPAAATTPKVTFANTNTPTGYLGHIVLGATSSAAISSAITRSSSNDYTIDGSNTPGGTTRDLTIQAGTPALFIDTDSGFLINVVGDNDSVDLKNLKLGLYDSADSPFVIGFSGLTLSATNLTPDSGLVENCEIVAGGTAPGASAIQVGTAAALSAPSAVQSTTIRANTITARQRGVELLVAGTATVEQNSITLGGGTDTALDYSAIAHLGANANVSWVVNINRNLIDMTMPSDATAIDMAADPAAIGFYLVKNNIVRNMQFTGLAPASPVTYRGIAGRHASCGYTILHNSLNMPHNANIAPASQQAVSGIVLTQTLGGAFGTATIEGNIVAVQQTGFGANALSIASSNAVTCDYNCLYAPEAIAWRGANLYTSFAQWQVGGGLPAGFGGFDHNGQNFNPATTSPAWDANLHFATKPIAGLATIAPLESVDFDGETRTAGPNTYPGADEPSITATGQMDWAQY